MSGRGYYDPVSDCVLSDEKYIGTCMVCKQTYLKKHMVTVLARRQYQNPKTITHICQSCFSTLCERYEIEGV